MCTLWMLKLQSQQCIVTSVRGRISNERYCEWILENRWQRVKYYWLILEGKSLNLFSNLVAWNIVNLRSDFISHEALQCMHVCIHYTYILYQFSGDLAAVYIHIIDIRSMYLNRKWLLSSIICSVYRSSLYCTIFGNTDQSNSFVD